MTMPDDPTPKVDYAAWAIDMCSLLDAIELNADDPKRVRKLCQGRFEMALKHGVEVRMHPHLTGGNA